MVSCMGRSAGIGRQADAAHQAVWRGTPLATRQSWTRDAAIWRKPWRASPFSVWMDHVHRAGSKAFKQRTSQPPAGRGGD